MSWLLAAGQGVLWGAFCGLIKYRLLWRPLFRPLDADSAAVVIGLHVALSHLFNLVSLAAIFLLCRHRPFWEAVVIAAAVSLSLAGRIPIFVRARRAKAAETRPAGLASPDPQLADGPSEGLSVD